MVVTIGEILQRPLRDCFTTVHVKGQLFGEIESNFFREHKAEFGNDWYLFDKHGLQHRVMVDDEGDVPLITNGWMHIREHYKFKGHHEIFFKYLGQNYFQIIPNMTEISPTTFPTWHSEGRPLRKAVTFKFTITEDPEVNPDLILPKELGEYMAQTFLIELSLVAVDVEPVPCRLRYRGNPVVVTMVEGWQECCRVHGFKVGDKIAFNMSAIRDNYMIRVRKLC